MALIEREDACAETLMSRNVLTLSAA